MTETNYHRRGFLKKAGSVSVIGVSLLAGCTSGSSDTTTKEGATSSMTSEEGATSSMTSEEGATSSMTSEGKPIPPDNKKGGSIVAGMGNPPATLDPHKMDLDASWRTVVNLYEGIYDRAPDLKMVPVLADRIDISDDGKQFDIKLKKGVMFHPPESKEMTADDVVYTWNRLQNSDESIFGDYLHPPIKSVKKTDKYSVAISLSRSSAPILQKFIVFRIVPVDASDNYELDKMEVGTGPFKLDKFVLDSHVNLSKFDEYWGTDKDENQLPYLKQVEMRAAPEASSRISNLKNGQFSHIFPLPPSQFKNLKNDKNVQTWSISGTKLIWIQINTRNPPLDDVTLRQSINYAINREKIINGAYYGLVSLTQVPISPAHATAKYVKIDNPYSQNIDKAKKLVKNSDYSGEEMTIIAQNSKPTQKDFASILQQQLDNIGIKTKINLVDGSSFIDRVRVGPKFDFELAVGSLGGRADPSNLLDLFITRNTSANGSGFSNKQFDKLYEKQTKISNNPQKRAKVITKMVNILHEKSPSPVIGYGKNISAGSPDLEGYIPHASTAWSQQWKTVWLND